MKGGEIMAKRYKVMWRQGSAGSKSSSTHTTSVSANSMAEAKAIVKQRLMALPSTVKISDLTAVEQR